MGDITTFNYDGTTRKISSIEYPTGLTTSYNYGTDAFVSSTVDSPSGGTNSFTWEKALIKTHTDERGLTRTFFYDNLQRVGVSFPDSTTISNRYDKLDLVAIKDRLGRWSTLGFNNMRNLTHVTNALGNITKYGYCDCGTLETITNALGQVTTFGYDNAGRQTTITYPDSSVKSFRYDKMGRLTNEQNSLGIVGYIYNNQSLIVSVTNAAGLVEGYGYDIEDQPIYVTNSSGVKTTQEFDALGRVVKRTYPDTGYELFEYSNRGLISHTNETGKITRFTYDQSGNQLSQQTPNSEYIYFTNNAAGDLIALKDGKSQVTIWTNDIYGRVISKKLPNNALVLTNNYDANGQLTQRWSVAKGKTIYSYDAVGSLTNVNYPASTDLKFKYDALNRITNMVDAVGTTKYTYHTAGGLLTEDGPWSSDTVTYAYNGSLLRSSLSVEQPSASAWTHSYGYDTSSRLQTLTASEGTFTYSHRLAGSQITNIALPNTSKITNSYDSVGRLSKTVLLKNDGNVLNSHTYTYNYGGQRTNQTRTDNSYVSYGYDNLGQLKSGWGYTSGGTPINSEKRGYVYDTAWNMTSRTNDATVVNYSVNNLNQVTVLGSEGFSYDGNGNRTWRGSSWGWNWYYSYDDENQLTGAEGAGYWKSEFVYDGRMRRRIAKHYTWQYFPGYGYFWVQTGETRYLYDGKRVIEERNSSNSPQVRYTRGLDLSGTLEGAGGIGGMLARTASGSTAYYHADGNGNITAMIDSGQNIVASYRYDPFGNTISSSGTLSGANTYRFSSKEVQVHGNSGFYYYGYRYYDPNIQRWLNRDPIEEAGGINLYALLSNDPINFIDPFGLAEGDADLASLLSYNDALKLGHVRMTRLDPGGPPVTTAQAAAGAGFGGSAFAAAGLIGGIRAGCQISGFRKHGINQVINRNVKPQHILNTLRNPTKIIQQPDGVLKIVGQDATVVVNKAGEVMTAW